MELDRHRCSRGLPVIGLSISAWWCVSCQAPWMSGHVYRQDGAEDALRTIAHRSLVLGPFDDVDDLQPALTGLYVDWRNARA